MSAFGPSTREESRRYSDGLVYWDFRAAALGDYRGFARVIARSHPTRRYTDGLAFHMSFGELEIPALESFFATAALLGMGCFGMSQAQTTEYLQWVSRRAADGERAGGGKFDRSFGPVRAFLNVAGDNGKTFLDVGFARTEGTPATPAWPRFCTIR